MTRQTPHPGPSRCRRLQESDPARQGHRVDRVGCRGRRGRTVPLRLGGLSPFPFPDRRRLRRGRIVNVAPQTVSGRDHPHPRRRERPESNRSSSWRRSDPVPYRDKVNAGAEPARDRQGRTSPGRRPTSPGCGRRCRSGSRDRQAGRGPPPKPTTPPVRTGPEVDPG